MNKKNLTKCLSFIDNDYLKMKRCVALGDVASDNRIMAMQQQKRMQQNEQQQPIVIEKKIWKIFRVCYSTSSSQPLVKFLCPENEIKQGIRTSTHCSSILQQPISWNHANKRDQSTNTFTHETLRQHNFLNMQPFSMM